MWRWMSARKPNTALIASAHIWKYNGGPPAESAHDPTYDAATLPTRPTATVAPTPVPRIAVGNTCAASAYIVACTALSNAPESANITITLVAGGAVKGMRDICSEAAAAAAAIVSSVTRDPSR